jgi:AcrR family transcriptional regulator
MATRPQFRTAETVALHYKQGSGRGPDVQKGGGESRPRRGVRRSERAHGSILAATDAVLGAVGYGGLTVEEVAARAGVGKATVYRWWRTKGALVAEALSRHLVVGTAPATGDVRADLLALVRVTISNYSGTMAGTVLPAIAADIANSPDAWNALVSNFLAPRRALALSVLQAHIASGALPADTDAHAILDIWGGTVFYRVLMTRKPADEQLARQLVDMVITAPPRRCDAGPVSQLPGSSSAVADSVGSTD